MEKEEEKQILDNKVDSIIYDFRRVALGFDKSILDIHYNPELISNIEEIKFIDNYLKELPFCLESNFYVIKEINNQVVSLTYFLNENEFIKFYDVINLNNTKEVYKRIKAKDKDFVKNY